CNMGNGRRFKVAAGLPHSAVMCIDDDIFPTADQIEELFKRAVETPDRPHGVWGEKVRSFFGRISFKTHICNTDTEVDILNRLYVFTPEIGRRALDLAKLCGYCDWSKIGPLDDVFLSFAGARKPLCHDVGALADCPTSDEPGIASWRSSGFFERRADAIRRIRNQREALSERRSSRNSGAQTEYRI
ncbi:MAG TPA: hypothetical protein VJM82_01805, partial [Nitrospiraceae bacterium]|nr:hypothetical protein [Nitrospiraceae bacterium]